MFAKKCIPSTKEKTALAYRMDVGVVPHTRAICYYTILPTRCRRSQYRFVLSTNSRPSILSIIIELRDMDVKMRYVSDAAAEWVT
jgi:hypothetical protein